MKNRARRIFTEGTAEMIAEVILLEGEELAPGNSGFVAITTK